MRLKVDQESDALYFRLDESAIVESEEVQPGVILDFDAEGHVVGIETLNLSSRVAPERLRTLHFETIYLAGCCQGPKDVPDTVAQGKAAASSAIVVLSKMRRKED